MVLAGPTRVVIAGDWHGNSRWAVPVIWNTRSLLPDESPRIIVHCGDFGFWPYKVKEWGPGDKKPEGLQYLLDVQSACELADATMLVTPGNHEDYDAMETWTDPGYPEYAAFQPNTPMGRMDRIFVLPRGHRWTWHGRTWLSVGGAVSVDRLLPRPGRIQGVSWWPQEEVTWEQAGKIMEHGHADVMVCHDSPAMVPIPDDHHMQPYFAPEDMERAKAHSRLMQAIVDDVKPSWYLHGHHHRRYTRELDFGWGPIRFDGMGMDGDATGNIGVLDVRSMTWQ